MSLTYGQKLEVWKKHLHRAINVAERQLDEARTALDSGATDKALKLFESVKLTLTAGLAIPMSPEEEQAWKDVFKDLDTL